MNEPLLRQIISVIEAEPHKLDMCAWEDERAIPGDDGKYHCQTTRCIAGWALYLSNDMEILHYDNATDIARQARGRLDIDTNQGAELFYLNEWPWKFAAAYENCMSVDDFQGMTNVTVARIEDFIERYGDKDE
jgi:hypothetical protein